MVHAVVAVTLQLWRVNEKTAYRRLLRKCLMHKENSGRGERIRTSGLYVPNVALYQAKLHPDVGSAKPIKKPLTVLLAEAASSRDIR